MCACSHACVCVCLCVCTHAHACALESNRSCVRETETARDLFKSVKTLFCFFVLRQPQHVARPSCLSHLSARLTGKCHYHCTRSDGISLKPRLPDNLPKQEIPSPTSAHPGWVQPSSICCTTVQCFHNMQGFVQSSTLLFPPPLIFSIPQATLSFTFRQ